MLKSYLSMRAEMDELLDGIHALAKMVEMVGLFDEIDGSVNAQAIGWCGKSIAEYSCEITSSLDEFLDPVDIPK